MFKQVKKLAEENKLSFVGNHRTNPNILFEEHKEHFLKRIEKEIEFEKELENKFGVSTSTFKKAIFEEAQCFDCGKEISYYLKGEQLVPYHFDGEEYVPSDLECFKQEEVIVDIPVPSGELLFADWFKHGKELFHHLEEEDKYEYLSLKVKVKKTKEYAKEGIGHFYVSNTSPVVFQKENRLIIGHTRFDDENYEKYEETDDWDGYEMPPEEGAEEKGNVGTELWWVSICDRTIYEQMAIEKFGEEKGKEMTEDAVKHAKRSHVIVQVSPGFYRLRYFTSVNDDTVIHATLEKIDE